MDPVLGSILVAFIASSGAIVTAIITARSNADRLIREQRIKRLERKVTDLGGDPNEDA